MRTCSALGLLGALALAAPALAGDGDAAPAADAKLKLLASPSMHAYGFTGEYLICYFTNIGKSAAKLKDVRLVYVNGTFLTPAANTCGATLGAGRSCHLSIDPPALQIASCQASVEQGAEIRGRVEVRRSSDAVKDVATVR